MVCCQLRAWLWGGFTSGCFDEAVDLLVTSLSSCVLDAYRQIPSSIKLQVEYSSRKNQLGSYARPPLKKEAYTSAIASLANNKEASATGM